MNETIEGIEIAKVSCETAGSDYQEQPNDEPLPGKDGSRLHKL